MGRRCGDCGLYCDRYDFSLNQWQKGTGASRCKSCVGNVTYQYQCGECYREFKNQNNLDHHNPRSVACPVCGKVRFRSGTNMLQHVESGFCSCCPGRDNARQQIYNFASSMPSMKSYISSAPQLTYGGDAFGTVPDYPYACPDCAKPFKQLSQLFQHQGAKHTSNRLLGYH